MKLNAESQAAINDKLVAMVGQFFNYDVLAWSELPGGIENTVISVTLPDGTEKVQKHYNRDRELTRVSLELLIMGAAEERAVPVPQLDEAANGVDFVFKHRAQGYEWYVVSMNKIDGHHPDAYQSMWTNELASHHARLHSVDSSAFAGSNDIDLANDYGYFPIDPVVHPALTDLSVAVAHHREKVDDAWHNLPSGLSHHDITRSNVLISGDTVAAVIDFEDVAKAPYIFCLAGTLWDVLVSTGVDEAREYLANYKMERPLSALESNVLEDMIVIRGWIDLHGKLLTVGYNSGPHLKTQRHLEELISGRGLNLAGMTK